MHDNTKGMSNTKGTYAAPALTVFGSVRGLTGGSSTMANTDAGMNTGMAPMA